MTVNPVNGGSVLLWSKCTTTMATRQASNSRMIKISGFSKRFMLTRNADRVTIPTVNARGAMYAQRQPRLRGLYWEAEA